MGASRGLGREVARQLAERGYEVLLGARNAAEASAVAEELTASTGKPLTPLTPDISVPTSIAAAAEQLVCVPGFVKTDMGSPTGATKSVEESAAGIVWLATLPDDGPTGGFHGDGQPIAL